MVNVLLYWCCATQINSSRKLGRGAVMRLFVKRSILVLLHMLLDGREGQRLSLGLLSGHVEFDCPIDIHCLSELSLFQKLNIGIDQVPL